MIKAKDAIATARGLIGTPYSEMDCIALIRAIIRRSSGGVKDYRCEGTNWLWDSVKNSGRYRHLTQRREGLTGAQAGMLAFKRYGMEDEGHVGLVTDVETVIHSSSLNGRGVVETPLTAAEGWDLLGVHRYIETAASDAEKEEARSMIYKAQVATEKDPLRVRDYPATGEILGHVPKGATVEVLEELDNGWAKVRYNELEGWASVLYLERVEDGAQNDVPIEEDVGSIAADMTIIDSAGNRFKPVGDWRVLVGSVDSIKLSGGQSID